MHLPVDNQIPCCDCGQQYSPYSQSRKLHRSRLRCIDCERVRRNIYARNRKLNATERVVPVVHPQKNKRRKRYKCSNDCGAAVRERNQRCLTCYNKSRSRKAIQLSRQKTETQYYACAGLCGKLLSKQKSRCIECKKSFQDATASKSEHKMKMNRVMKSFSNGSTFGVMFVGGDAYALSWRCTTKSCGKPVLVQGKCYKHATGNPITLSFRPRVMLQAAQN